MDSSTVIAVLGSTTAAIGVSLITNLVSRPKVKAEAGVADANAQVAISTDARGWATEFRDSAAKAEARAQKAEERADEADGRASAVEARMDALDHRFDLAIGYIRTLQREVAQATGHNPPPPPVELIPPLSPI